MVTRVLGVDLGSRRVGLAIADVAVGIARPLSTIPRGATVDADAEAIGRVCREQGVVELGWELPVLEVDLELEAVRQPVVGAVDCVAGRGADCPAGVLELVDVDYTL